MKTLVLYGEQGSAVLNAVGSSSSGSSIRSSSSSNERGAEGDTSSRELERICVAHMRLTEIPRVAFQSSALLTHLNLSFNRIEVVPDISELRVLQYLDISHNKVSHIECLPSNLRSLRCNNNELDSMKFVRNLTKLTELWVSSNKLPWTELINILGLTELSIVVKYGNPADDKPKCNEFISAIAPSVRNLDGMVITVPTGAQGDSFLISTDGRQMLNQIRPTLTPEQKQLLHKLRGNSKLAVTHEPDGTGFQGVYQGEESVAEVSVEVENNDGNSGVASVDKPTVKVKTISSGYDQKTKLPKKFIASESANDNIIDEESASKQTPPVSAAPVAVKILRFGLPDEAPVAMCLNDDGSGYVR
jgi:hypothetical protein